MKRHRSISNAVPILGATTGAAVPARSGLQVPGRLGPGAGFVPLPGKCARRVDEARPGFRGPEALGGGAAARFLLHPRPGVDAETVGGFAGSGGPGPFVTGTRRAAASGGFDAGGPNGFSRGAISRLGSKTAAEWPMRRKLMPSAMIFHRAGL